MIAPAYLRPDDLADYYASRIVAEDILRAGLLRPFTQEKRLTLYCADEAHTAAIHYREQLRNAGGRTAWLSNQPGTKN